MLFDFREKNREIYNMHYEDLEDLVDHFCKNFGNSEEDNEEWFCGRDVCLILGFQNIGDALTKMVKKAYKRSLKDLAVGPESGPSPELNNENKAVYISELGLYQVIFSSRLETAK